MRNLLFALAAGMLALTAMPAGKAEAAPFCSYIGGPTSGFQSCAYRTWDQCLAAISGAGGFCMVNPSDAWAQGVRRRPYR
ncbi:MAG TPA: DUF3551 domain-containing protein [Xanthobacteraceae bacterium]|nr:DUF3551 domain-containing protein [Xanthobacteraceae bacterium]